MKEICELIMLLCFGISWPISVYKSIKTKSTKGKSVVFLFAIIFGYLFGIAGKFISHNITYVLVFYFVNLVVVSTDLIIYFINKHNESTNALRRDVVHE